MLQPLKRFVWLILRSAACHRLTRTTLGQVSSSSGCKTAQYLQGSPTEATFHHQSFRETNLVGTASTLLVSVLPPDSMLQPHSVWLPATGCSNVVWIASVQANEARFQKEPAPLYHYPRLHYNLWRPEAVRHCRECYNPHNGCWLAMGNCAGLVQRTLCFIFQRTQLSQLLARLCYARNGFVCSLHTSRRSAGNRLQNAQLSCALLYQWQPCSTS